VFSAAAALAAAGLSAAAGLVMLRGKNAELTAERDRAVLAEAEAVRLRERAEGALAGEAEARRLADGQRKAAESALATAESALRTAEARLALARQAVDRCFEIAEGHPLLQAPGMDEVRELLRRTAVDFRDRIAATGGGFAVRREAAAARFRAARETASLKGKPEAIRLYREVIAELVPLIRDDPGDVDLRMNLATARENLGNLLQQAGDRAAALDEFRWAVAARVEEMRTTGRKPWLMDALANSRTILGNALRETDPQAALAEHRAALAIRLGLTTLEDSERRARPGRFPGADNFGWAGVVQSRNAIGSVLGDIGDADGALREFGAALAVAAGTLRLAPTYAAHRAQLAAAYHGLGVTLESKGDPRAAAEAYRGALAVGEALVAGNPAVVEFRRALSDSRNNLGILLEELGDRAGALRELRATLEIRRRLAADSPTVVEFRRGLGSSHHNLGSLLGDAGEAAASLREFRDALAVRARLASEFPAEPALRRDLSNTFAPMAIAHQSAGRLPQTARCLDRRNAAAVAVPNPGGRPDPRPLFDAACTVAGFIPSVAEGERDDWAAVATALLRDAMSAGSADAAAARRNPDLAPLRDRPDFKALMLEWENPLRTPKPRAK
jgi:tetratricopeptide (TPR) repeat protein